jgi:hypothetical protein
MQKKSLALLLSVSFALVACGSGGITTPARKKQDLAKDPPKDQKNCPAVAPTDFHKITVNFTRALPAKIGIKLEGDADVRVSECAQRDVPGQRVSFQKNGNQLLIGVDHNNAYGSLPMDARFEVVDLQACGNTSSTFFKQTASLPILYKKEFPNGAHCAYRMAGEAQITPIGMVE